MDAATAVFLFYSCYSAVYLHLRIPFPPTSGWRRVSPDTAGSVRPLVPHRVLRLCVSAGGSDSAQQHHIRRLPDEHRGRPPDRTVGLLRPSLPTHLHASRWRSRSKNSRVLADRQTNDDCIFFFICTSTAVKLVTGLVGVAQSLTASAENSQTLYDVQKAKRLRHKSAAQLEKMQKKITEVSVLSLRNQGSVIQTGVSEVRPLPRSCRRGSQRSRA